MQIQNLFEIQGRAVKLLGYLDNIIKKTQDCQPENVWFAVKVQITCP